MGKGREGCERVGSNGKGKGEMGRAGSVREREGKRVGKGKGGYVTDRQTDRRRQLSQSTLSVRVSGGDGR